MQKNKRVLFKIDRDKDFKNHLIQLKWFNKAGFNLDQKDKKYFKSLSNTNSLEEKRKKFEKYSSDFYSKNNRKNLENILNYYQKCWDEIEGIYVAKMEEIHGKEFPYDIILGILSSTSIGWGVNFEENNAWFACPSKHNKKFLQIAMHEIMHAFFQKYFMSECVNKFDLDKNQIWAVQESLTVILNLEFKDILSEIDVGYPQHEELRKMVEKNWLEKKDINKLLNKICQVLKN